MTRLLGVIECPSWCPHDHIEVDAGPIFGPDGQEVARSTYEPAIFHRLTIGTVGRLSVAITQLQTGEALIDRPDITVYGGYAESLDDVNAESLGQLLIEAARQLKEIVFGPPA